MPNRAILDKSTVYSLGTCVVCVVGCGAALGEANETCFVGFQEKQKKLWHSTYYENEVQFKQLYVKICKNLPSYGCKLFQVKEIQRGNTQKKVSIVRVGW